MGLYILRMILTAFIVFVLQVTLGHVVSLGEASPDMILILLVVLVLNRKPAIAVIIGFLLGFLQDLGNASYLGMNALVKSVTAYGIARYATGFLPDSTLFKGLLIFISCLAGDIILFNITTSFNPLSVFISVFRYGLLSALYTAVTGIVVFNILHILPGRTVRSGGGY